jgi:5'(3')-deoxyribonucleotidase
MRIGVDLDGVVYDFVGALRDYLVEVHSYDPAHLKSPTTWAFGPEWGLTEEEFNHHCDEATDAEWLFVYGDPIPGAHSAISYLREQGHSIHIITARNFGTKSESNTRIWLDRHNFPRQSLTFAHDKTILDADIFIDDKRSNIDGLNAAGKYARLLKDPVCPDRKDSNGHPFLVESWQHFVETVDELDCYQTSLEGVNT